MTKRAYLERIKYSHPFRLSNNYLAKLHEQHVYHVPFENLDVYHKRIFDLDLKSIYKKVIHTGRGGFCYELNLLFNWLLNEIGFSGRIIASRIIDEQGKMGPEFDHMSVYVKTDKEFLVDVGYGDLFVTPLEIRSGIQSDGRNYFKIDKHHETSYLLSMSSDGIDFQQKYLFNLDVVQPEDFREICLDKQTNPNSYFVKNLVCTRLTDVGRVTIFNERLIEKNGGSRSETIILSDAELSAYLKERFDIVLKH